MRTKAILHNKFVTYKKLGTYGRLANQLFQVAAVLSYSKRKGVPHIIPSWQNRWTDGADMTEIFKGPFNVNDDVINCETSVFKELSMEYEEITGRDRLNLEGYFQCEKYIDEKHIKDCFSIEPLIEKEIIERNSGLFEEHCSIHIRRDDYLKYPDIHPFLGEEYYRKAIDMMKERGYKKFLIFSDDLGWCKGHFKGNEFLFSDRNYKNYEDLILMSICSSHIIANSTFSWWGAWLRDTEKTVIAPENWFGVKGPQKYDIVPKKWIQI